MLYGIFDPETSSLCLANAGHPPPLVATPNGGATFLEGGLGPPLGVVESHRFAEASYGLRPGSTVVMYTDGLVEDRATSLDAGLDRVQHLLATAPVPLEALCDHLMAGATSGRDASDDTALLAMRCVELGAHLSFRLPTRPGVLRPLRATIRRWLGEAGATEQESFEIVVAVGEACANAVQHAGSASPEFEFEGSIDDQVRIVIRDNGVWRDPSPSIGGRGIAIMRQFMDEAEVRRGPHGTEVILQRSLGTARMSGHR
jgi:anti-sigma regulatory factor (Ser/Thr protein kinase)